MIKTFRIVAVGLLAISGSAIVSNAAAETEPEVPVSDEYFQSVLVSKDFTFEDGYMIESADFTGDGYPDIVTFGLGAYSKVLIDDNVYSYPLKSKIYLFENPGIEIGQGDQSWKHRVIADLDTPVALNKVDIDGDGDIDILMSNEYGKDVNEPLNGGGAYFWLENPGKKGIEQDKPWMKHLIGNHTAMHRIVVGKFTQDTTPQIIAMPVTGKQHNVHAAIPLAIHTVPTNPKQIEPWDKNIIMDSYFHVIHDAWVGKNDALSDFDVLLVGSQEGINWLYFGRDEKWHIEPVSKGETDLSPYINPVTNEPKTVNWFTGTNTPAPGKVNGNPHEFIAAIEPFHGTKLATYVKKDGAWQRNVIGQFGEVDSQGFGTGHYMLTHDFDQDGTDEFIGVFLRPPAGLIYGKVNDLESNSFDVVRVFEKSTARATLADFNQDGKKDIATIGYKVRFYYEEDEPQLYIHLNIIDSNK